MKSLLLIHSKKGSVIIYTLFLTFFAIVAAYLLVTKSETLFLSLENTRDAAKLDKNLEASADLAIKYAASLQKDGGGFNDTIVCPSDFTLTNTSSGTIVFAGTSTWVFSSGILFCEGNAGTPLWNYRINYGGSGTSFVSAEFLGINNTLSAVGPILQWPNFTGSGGFQYKVSFTTPTTFSGIDYNGDSDDRQGTSSGSIPYPGEYRDNDDLGRKIGYGYIRKNTGFGSILWSNARTNDYIRANLNNSGAVIPGTVSSGALYISIDSPYTLRIEEYDRASYRLNREFKVLTGSTIFSGSGGIGYLQNDLSLSGEYGSTWALIWARMFDFANRDYALFLSFSGSTIDPNADFLRYQIKASTSTGSSINIVPLNDENVLIYRYLAGTVIPTSKGDRISKMNEIIRPAE